MNSELIARALCFHGQPMQKIWEDERGAGDLQKWGVPQHPNYAIYQERQKHFTFQDRAKRLKLHQFFSRKANDLYEKDQFATIVKTDEDEQVANAKSIAVTPPYEMFVNKQQDRAGRWRYVLEAIKPGDIVYGVTKGNITTSSIPLLIKPLCTEPPLVRYLRDIPTKAYVQPVHMAQPLEKRGKQRQLSTPDYVRCEVLEISVDADRLTLGIEGIFTKNKNVKLGIVNQEDLPAYYQICSGNVLEKYEEYLLNSKEMLNPNYDALFEINGLDVNETFSMMRCFKNPFPSEQYARELRQTQASKWAFRAVAEGIEHFKIGNHVEAFQCLNKALNIDPRNVEGLVARGALYANKGSFLKAVEDFEKALKLNSYHVNARKYMGETLVALGRSYEEENRIQDAAKAYRDCLNIIPNHEQARLSLEAIQQRPGSQLFDIFNTSGASDSGKQKKKKRSDSGTSSNDESSTDSNSSDVESESSDTLRNTAASLSPLSKRMALHAASLAASEAGNQYSQPFVGSSSNGADPTLGVTRNPNEFKLEDDDTEKRVRKLLQEASKHKKEKVKKSKKKKSKKSKKDNHKEKDVANALLGNINFEEAYKVFSGLNIESKLNENLQIYEKTIAEIKKRQDVIQQSASIVKSSNAIQNPRQRSETPPPKAPSMKITESTFSFNLQKNSSTYALGNTASTSTSVASRQPQPQQKLSFQIRKPVKVDKFGLVRIATPLMTQHSPSASPKRRPNSRSRPNYRRQLSASRTSLSRQRRSSSSRRRRPHSRSRSRSRHSNRRRRSRSRDRGVHGRQHIPSPFVPRRTSPRRRRSNDSRGTANRSRHLDRYSKDQDRYSKDQDRYSKDQDRYSKEQDRYSKEQDRQMFGNRVWQRPGYVPPILGSKEDKPENGRWLHDKFDDGPSIEEIDEIINKAQKERKQEIIKRDKNILKKPSGNL